MADDATFAERRVGFSPSRPEITCGAVETAGSVLGERVVWVAVQPALTDLG